jgi:hypothetical protein
VYFLLIILTAMDRGSRPDPESKPQQLTCSEDYIKSLVERSCLPCHGPGNGRTILHYPKAFRYNITKAMIWSKRGHGNPAFTNKEHWEIRCWFYGENK